MKQSTAECFWSKVDKSNGPDSCWPWTGGKFGNGYGRAFYQNGVYGAHRLAAILYGLDVDGLLVCHKCDNKSCCNPNHFFIGTPRENIQDAAQKGRLATGARNGAHTKPETRARGEIVTRARLKTHQIPQIRELHANGVSQAEIARRYNIARRAIYSILHQATWRHVP